MMLRKRTMSSLFVGLNKPTPDPDPARSPTSPLDHMLFPNPLLLSPRLGSPRRSWDNNRVGLGLVDTLLESRAIVFGSQVRCRSSPRSHELLDGLQTMSCPSDIDFLNRVPKSLSPVAADAALPTLLPSLSASEIEMSEDYTRITTHGPNPKTTHMFGDCVLEIHPPPLPAEKLGSSWLVSSSSEDPFPSLPFDDFLSSCYSCKKRLGDGADIYMYRGEKAFCSCECRDEEILKEENKEEHVSISSSFSSSTIWDGIC